MTFKLQSKKTLKVFCSGIPLCQSIFLFMETASGLESLVILVVVSSSSRDLNCTVWEPTFISLTYNYQRWKKTSLGKLLRHQTHCFTDTLFTVAIKKRTALGLRKMHVPQICCGTWFMQCRVLKVEPEGKPVSLRGVC